jgi:hypothetical protein
MKPSDQLENPQQLAFIKAAASQAIEKAGAFGIFPTPVDDIIEAARHSVVLNHEIDDQYLADATKKAGGLLKKALSKTLGVLDVKARTIYLDTAVRPAQMPFLKLHELGHGLLPWQRDTYALTADCKQTLDPEINELFERETNAFASEVLFQVDTFTQEAADYNLCIKTPLSLSRRYGASFYSTVRRYVRTNPRACAVLILEPPEVVPGHGYQAKIRRVVASPVFEAKYNQVVWSKTYTPDHALGKVIPFGRKMTGPRQVLLADANGTYHECIAEGFDSTHHVFILIYPRAAITRKAVLISA